MPGPVELKLKACAQLLSGDQKGPSGDACQPALEAEPAVGGALREHPVRMSALCRNRWSLQILNHLQQMSRSLRVVKEADMFTSCL